MKNQFEIRLISETDVAAVLEIYTYYVENTIISFEYEAPSIEEYLQRIITNTVNYPWIVCLYNSQIIGFAYGSTHRYRTAYQWSPESTIYMAPDFHTKGIGKLLYELLLSLLKLQGYYNVYAGVALPNDKSIGLHKKLGFDEIGIFQKVGYKHGDWHDTHWFQIHLNTHKLEPATPKKLKEVANSSPFQSLLTKANDRINNMLY